MNKREVIRARGLPLMEEKKSLDLYRRMSTLPDAPAVFRNTLTKEFVAEYLKIITSKEVVEMDWIHLTGQVTVLQAEQYVSLCVNQKSIIDAMTSLAERMSEHFGPKLPELLREDARGNDKKGVKNLFVISGKLHKLSLPELFEASFNGHISRTFSEFFLALITVKIIEISHNHPDDNLRILAKNFVKKLDKDSLEKFYYRSTGTLLYKEIKNNRSTFSNKLNMDKLDDLIGYRPLNSEERKHMEMVFQSDYREIVKENSYKKVFLHKFTVGYPQIIFFSDDFDGHPMSSTFRINFNENIDIGLPKPIYDHVGNMKLDYDDIEGVSNFAFRNGELCFINNPRIKFSELLDADRYLFLKSYLAKQLKQYLQAKEPDIDDMFAKSSVENVKDLRQEVLEKVEILAENDQPILENPVEDKIGETEEQAVEMTWIYQSFEIQEPESSFETKVPESNLKTLPKHKRKAIIDKIWGAKGAEVIAALKRMLGPSIRQQGSHVFFYSERTSLALPVPNSDNIPPPLVMNNLKNWGYSLMEYAAELGARVD